VEIPGVYGALAKDTSACVLHHGSGAECKYCTVDAVKKMSTQLANTF
jgi:hypothetical protein